MDEVWIYTLLSVLIVSLISFVGILTFSLKVDKLKKILLYMVSFSAGALFGGAFIHMLPEIVEEVGFGFDIRVLPGMTFENLKDDIEDFLLYLTGKNKNLDAELVFEKPPMIVWTPPSNSRPGFIVGPNG